MTFRNYRTRTAIHLGLLIGAGIFLYGLLIDWPSSTVENFPQNQYYHQTADPDSSSTRPTGHWSSGPPIEDVAIDGQTIGLVNGSGLTILDASEPKRPHQEGRVSLSGPVVDVDVNGERAYAITNHFQIAGTPHRTKEFGLEVFDISVPTAPEEIGVFKTSGAAREVTVTGGFAFVADGRDGLRVVDVSGSSLSEVAFFGPSSDAVAVAASGEVVYLADGSDGLWVIDAAWPSEALHKLGRYNPVGYVSDVAVAGEYAFVAVSDRAAASGRTGDVRVLDVSDPRSPREVGTFGLSGQPEDIAISGDRAYTSASGGAALQVFSISTPDSPRRVVAIEAVSGGKVAVSDQHVYLAGGYPRRLHIFDVSTSADNRSEKR
jgi:hypothetical protein